MKDAALAQLLKRMEEHQGTIRTLTVPEWHLRDAAKRAANDRQAFASRARRNQGARKGYR